MHYWTVVMGGGEDTDKRRIYLLRGKEWWSRYSSERVSEKGDLVVASLLSFLGGIHRMCLGRSRGYLMRERGKSYGFHDSDIPQ